MSKCQSKRRDGKSCNNPVKDDQVYCWVHQKNAMQTHLDAEASGKIYTLQNDGDVYERIFLPYLAGNFPNYEVLWQRFITPLTRRDEDGSIQLKRDINPLFEELCMSHYSIYYHLGFSHQLRTWNGLIAFQAIFFHLSASTEMVERFLFALAKLYSHMDVELNSLKLLDEKSYNSNIREYWASKDDSNKSSYEQDYDRFYKTGQSVNVTLHNIDNIIREFCSRMDPKLKKNYGKWRGVAQQIRNYRNKFAHNPKLGLRTTGEGDKLVPKHDKLKKYIFWSDVIYNNREGDDFVSLRESIVKYQGDLEQKTNRLWSHLIEILGQLSEKDKYRQMIGTDKIRKSEVGKVPIIQALLLSSPLYNESLPSGTSSTVDIDSSASGISFVENE